MILADDTDDIIYVKVEKYIEDNKQILSHYKIPKKAIKSFEAFLFFILRLNNVHRFKSMLEQYAIFIDEYDEIHIRYLIKHLNIHKMTKKFRKCLPLLKESNKIYNITNGYTDSESFIATVSIVNGFALDYIVSEYDKVCELSRKDIRYLKIKYDIIK